MNLQYVRLLHIQRELYRLPRNLERFQSYLRTMLTPDRKDLTFPPLVYMNPLAKEHVPALLERYLGLGAEEVGAQVTEEMTQQLQNFEGDYQIGLVLIDDQAGGWTNRAACEYALCFPEKRPSHPSARQRWLSAVLWTSEEPSTQKIRDALRQCLCRWAYQTVYGCALTLREKLAQEGYVLTQAGCQEPYLEEDDLEYTRIVLSDLLDATDMRTAIECLYGDEAASSLGFTPRGLSPRAGLAFARHQALGMFTQPSNEDRWAPS